ncbi:hypothetical protein CKQ70_30535 [Bacillus toyonensis]|nr:hypothetical protein CKQ70_30535 [Bacillus toyonensis]
MRGLASHIRGFNIRGYLCPYFPKKMCIKKFCGVWCKESKQALFAQENTVKKVPKTSFFYIMV